jgi:predicted Rossmann fold flavoprotein
LPILSKSNVLDLAVIGGGAAGFFAAINLKELRPDLKISIFEGGNSYLSKVLISGGGRCNVTNATWDPRDLCESYPRGSKELLGPFSQFACGDTYEWFEARGIALKIEEDNRVFPQSDDAASIVDLLISLTEAHGIEISRKMRIHKIEKADLWTLQTESGMIQAKNIMVASGSNQAIWNELEKLGLNIIKPVPSLFSFNIHNPLLNELPGIATPVTIQIPELSVNEQGALLITHKGVSGPAVLKISAWKARELHDLEYRFTLIINWLNGKTQEAVALHFSDQRLKYGKQKVSKHPLFDLPKRLWNAICVASMIGEDKNWGELNGVETEALVGNLCAQEFMVQGKSTNKEEFVSAGGVDLLEINFKHFYSKKYPDMYLAGEVLDIDGITGGFNFQAAWTGAYIAAKSMASSL